MQQQQKNKQATFTSCAAITEYISKKKNNTQVDNVQDLGVVMPMYNLINTPVIMQKIFIKIPQRWSK